jgi:deoxyribonuclease IV
MPPQPARPPTLTARRIGIHTSTQGGVEAAAERAYRLGCNTLQIFSSSPRQWKPYELGKPQCELMNTLRKHYRLSPLVIHTNYLINLAGANGEFRRKSIAAFRGEIERALALCADYLVLHPGSFRGHSREEGLRRVATGIVEAVDGFDLKQGGLTILIENTAGAEFSLGSKFEQVAELVAILKGVVPAAACIDTCHTHVAGYDIVSEDGFRQTLKHLDKTVGLKDVKVWHCNDAKAARDSHLDRHACIGEGTIGVDPFRWLLNDPRMADAAFIAETPIEQPGDDQRNVDALKVLVKKSGHRAIESEADAAQAARVPPSAVVGSIIVRISDTRLAGKPPSRACFRTNSSDSAKYTQ